ncbi:MAG: peptidylprolyl isomerase [Bacteroidales bacterium]|nr:peptidylprolyl isomerase [Bacteroidales bacterium]
MKYARHILTLLCLLGMVTAAESQNGYEVDGVVAVVGKNIIKKSDIENSFLQIRIKQGSENGYENRCRILENMLLTKLLLHKGEVDSIKVTNEDVEAEVQYYLKNYVRQYGSREALREATGYTYDEMHDIFVDQLRNRQISQRVEYNLTQHVTVTPREVAQFYEKVKDSLPTIPESYEISEITISPSVSEEERDRVRTELARLRERVLNGEKFSMLATLYSQDPGSANKGGEVGFFTRGDMVGEFEAAAFALKPGEVSPIIETNFGFHILQLIERRGNSVNVRHILMIPKVSSDDLLRARMKLDSIAQEIRLGKTDFAAAARQYSDGNSKEQGGVVTHPTTGNNRFLLEELKELYPGIGFAAMESGDVTNATAMKTSDQRDAYRIVRIDRKLPPHQANLTDDYDRLSNAALQEAKDKKLLEWSAKMIKTTYIRLSDEYKDCDFKLNWNKRQ